MFLHVHQCTNEVLRCLHHQCDLIFTKYLTWFKPAGHLTPPFGTWTIMHLALSSSHQSSGRAPSGSCACLRQCPALLFFKERLWTGDTRREAEVDRWSVSQGRWEYLQRAARAPKWILMFLFAEPSLWKMTTCFPFTNLAPFPSTQTFSRQITDRFLDSFWDVFNRAVVFSWSIGQKVNAGAVKVCGVYKAHGADVDRWTTGVQVFKASTGNRIRMCQHI